MTGFKKSLKRLKEVCFELRALDESRNRKLTAGRFKIEALERASGTFAEISERFERADRLSYVQTAIRNLTRWIVSGDGGMNLTRTPNDRILSGMIRSDQAISEAASVNLQAFDLWLIAVFKAAEGHPDAFGPVDDPDTFAANVRLLEAEFTDLCNALENSWSARDIDFEPVGHNLIKAKFKAAPVYLQTDNGKRLGEYLRTNA